MKSRGSADHLDHADSCLGRSPRLMSKSAPTTRNAMQGAIWWATVYSHYDPSNESCTSLLRISFKGPMPATDLRERSATHLFSMEREADHHSLRDPRRIWRMLAIHEGHS